MRLEEIHHVSAIACDAARNVDWILYEIADDSPGFTVDSAPEDLGRTLILPPSLEPRDQEDRGAAEPAADPRAEWPIGPTTGARA
jgi:hypothetical protein